MSIMDYIKTGRKFFFLVGGLYVCSILSALNHERLLKAPFKNVNTGQMEYLKNVFLIAFTSHLVTALIGKTILVATKSEKKLPWKDCAACGLVINVGSYGYNSAIIHTSFPAVVMVKSCSLLSVIIVGVACSRVKDKKLKLGREKIIIGILTCLGIFLFNFGAHRELNNQNQPIELFSLGAVFLLISLVGDGFLPDFQAKIKSEHQPTAIQMYYSVNRWVATVAFVFMVVTGELFESFQWIKDHEGAFYLLLLISLLNSIGQLFVYQMLKEYRQHVPAFVIATRKCMTVLLSLFWYHHSLVMIQGFGLFFVFISIFLEVCSNYLNAQKQQAAVAQPLPMEEEVVKFENSREDFNKLAEEEEK